VICTITRIRRESDWIDMYRNWTLSGWSCLKWRIRGFLDCTYWYVQIVKRSEDCVWHSELMGFGLRPSPGILHTTEQNVSKTGSVFVFSWEEGDTYSLGPVRKSYPRTLDDSCQVKLYYDRRSVGQSVLVSGTHLAPATKFYPSFFGYF
jgi:hypothetical protein